MNPKILTALLILVGVLIALAVIVLLAKNKFGLHKKFDWGKLWDASKDTALAIVVVALALVFLNVLCSGFSLRWWLANRDHGPFWMTQIGIVFSVTVLMVCARKAAKVFALLVLILIVYGWWTVAANPNPVHVIVHKGEASPVWEVRKIKAIEHIPLLVRKNGQGEWKLQAADQTDQLDWDTTTVQYMSKDKDIHVELY